MNQSDSRIAHPMKLAQLPTPFLLLLTWLGIALPAPSQTLPNTQPLTLTGDIASNLVAGADRFLLHQIELAPIAAAASWHRDFSSAAAYTESLSTNRQRLAHILGVRDPRVTPVTMEVLATPTQPGLAARGAGFEVLNVRWPAFGDVHGEGLLLRPVGRDPIARLIAVPDADQTPEQLAGLTPGIPAASQFARRLAESGCLVVIPTLISRAKTRQSTLTDREFVYRPAFELGRHLIGYEVQKVLAAVDWLGTQNTNSAPALGVIGWGEGGLLAFYAAALDPRINAACVSGYFDDRRQIWQQPADRNVFGLLEQFGDAEVAAMISPRHLIVEAARGPELVLAAANGAPVRLESPRWTTVQDEFKRATNLVTQLPTPPTMELVDTGAGAGPCGSEATLTALLAALHSGAQLAPTGSTPEPVPGALADAPARAARQLHELDRHNQWLLTESQYTRQKFLGKLDTSTPEKFRSTAAGYRDFFYREVIGKFAEPLLPANPRTRQSYDQPKWTGYDVVLDVYPDLIAYGVLLLPKDLKAGERRPVVVCQHGLEGRPRDVIAGDVAAYHDFATRLCERGFVVFAPQNLYLFGDRFRTLQRKANPLGKTLYSLIVPQHQQITDWLKTQPFVDPARIAFYGLSYGGKTAMRVPPLVTNYCLSICSADFNEWVWKNASTRSPYSYTWSSEYEIFEFDLGSTFNYAEMAALIAPRPFMVERGHFDGVAPDETVAYEFAKVRYLYEARLGLKDQCTIEWFTGPHTIHGQGTFDFLHHHLNWPKPETGLK